jgi:DivIVA domain-containing protein
VSNTFPRARRSRPGYNVDQVEDFLLDARTAYSDPTTPSVVTAEIIRTMAFDMQKGGYSTSHVDAALERLEDAFAGRERDHAFSAAGGDSAWYVAARGSAQVILDRLARPARERFDREGWLTRGYDVDAVDTFADRLVDYFQHGKPMSIDEVRLVAFPVARRGYDEAQVDLLLDDVIAVMLAVR